MRRAVLTAMTAAHGPSSAATRTPPTAWAVVPSGIGKLNIITRKQYAAPSASSGTYRFFTTLRTRRLASTQRGVAPAYMTAHVCGLR
jgi:hypothetical protein